MISVRVFVGVLALFVSAGVGVCDPEGKVVDGKVWCVVNPSVNVELLRQGLDFACSEVDCSAIREGGACFFPNNVYAHASWAYNQYFQWKARYDYNCYFGNTALVSATDPSKGSCSYLFK